MDILQIGIARESALKDKAVAATLRRADRFSKMAVAAAQAALSGVEEKNIGIILATSFGPHPTTFKFLDNILDYKEKEVSPTLFSHSVHNAAVSYISTVLATTGPTLTVTGFSLPLIEALRLASVWLKSGVCAQVLVGAAEERGEVFDRLFKYGEGSVFFLLGPTPGLCNVAEIVFSGSVPAATAIDALPVGTLPGALALARSVESLAPGQTASCSINDCQGRQAVIKLCK